MKVQSENFIANGTFKYNLERAYYNYVQHVHRFAEIGYVIDGELDLTADGRTYRAKKGDFIYIAPMQLHGYHTPESTEFLVSAFTGTLIGDFLADNEGLCGVTPVFTCSESVRQFFHTTFIDGELGNDTVSVACSSERATETHIVDYSSPEVLYRIKSCLYAVLGEYCRTTEMVPVSGDANIFSDVMHYLADHYRDPVTLSSTAAAIGYSAGYLSHVIKKTCGMNFSAVLGSLRIEYAMYLIRSNYTGTMLELALECGFGTERSFHRMFRRVTGSTPGEYMGK
ncbi:MAG: AraC family transcriptional regulator [Clostridia bacterium]|nr:AraC family transcriptional regulator [Clostridia bacterium]